MEQLSTQFCQMNVAGRLILKELHQQIFLLTQNPKKLCLPNIVLNEWDNNSYLQEHNKIAEIWNENITGFYKCIKKFPNKNDYATKWKKFRVIVKNYRWGFYLNPVYREVQEPYEFDDDKYNNDFNEISSKLSNHVKILYEQEEIMRNLLKNVNQSLEKMMKINEEFSAALKLENDNGNETEKEDPSNSGDAYRQKLNEMAEKLKLIINSKDTLNMPRKFHERYITFISQKPLKLTGKFINDYIEYNEKVQPKQCCVTPEIKYFYWNLIGEIKQMMKTKYENRLEMCEFALKFPHYCLKEVHQIYEEYGARPLSPELDQTYKRMAQVVKNINGKRNFMPWIRCLLKLNDYDMIIANFESKLYREFNNKEIWKVYANYLQNRNPKALLDVYQRYCNKFVDDDEIQIKFQKEIERIGKLPEAVTNFWINRILFECKLGSLEAAYLMLEKALFNVMGKVEKVERKSHEEFFDILKIYEAQMKEKEKSIKSVSELPYETILRMQYEGDAMKSKEFLPIDLLSHFEIVGWNQNFSLPKPIIRYVTKYFTTSKVLEKFYQSCKFFYSQIQIPICHRLVIDDTVSSMPSNSTRCFQQSLIITSNDFNLNHVKDFYITNNLTCESENDRTFLSQTISKLYKCEAKYLKISYQDITVKEFKFLIEAGSKMKGIEFRGVRILDEQNVPVVIIVLNSILEERNISPKIFTLI